jgi:TPR repeat protein
LIITPLQMLALGLAPVGVGMKRSGYFPSVLGAMRTACCWCIFTDPPYDTAERGCSVAIRKPNHSSTLDLRPEKAIELYCQAARLGDMGAQYDLGWMYAMGRGIARDDAMAAYFFTMAAKQGDALAERMQRQVGSPLATAPKSLLTRMPATRGARYH